MTTGTKHWNLLLGLHAMAEKAIRNWQFLISCRAFKNLTHIFIYYLDGKHRYLNITNLLLMHSSLMELPPSGSLSLSLSHSLFNFNDLLTNFPLEVDSSFTRTPILFSVEVEAWFVSGGGKPVVWDDISGRERLVGGQGCYAQRKWCLQWPS